MDTLSSDMMVSYLAIGIGLIVLMWYVICYWRIFEKAGKDGWKCLIPFYNYITYLEIIGKPWWWLLIRICAPFIPFLGHITNMYFSVWGSNMLSKSFGKEEGFTVGLVFLNPIFVGILAFGEAQYYGPYGGVPRDDWQDSDNPQFKRGLEDVLDY